MSLYGKTDAAANVTKASKNLASSSQAKQIIFVDNTEAALSENKLRGINAPGWWSYFTYTDSDGHTRHKAEHLITIADPIGPETQADDTIAADIASAISITTQPSNQTAQDGEATFSVVATVSPSGTPVFQWQRRTTTSGKWVNLAGATSASLALTGLTAASNGYEFRVKVTSTVGSEEVISNSAELTV